MGGTVTSECAHKDALANLVQEVANGPRRDSAHRLRALPVLAGGRGPGSRQLRGRRRGQLPPAHRLHFALKRPS